MGTFWYEGLCGVFLRPFLSSTGVVVGQFSKICSLTDSEYESPEDRDHSLPSSIDLHTYFQTPL